MVEERSLEEMARALVESGTYRVVRRFEPGSECHPPDDVPKRLGAVVDVETTGTGPEGDRIIELGVCLFEFSRDCRVYRVIGSYEWFEDPGVPIPPEIVKLTGITDTMVAGRRLDENAVADLLSPVALVLAHNAAFDRPFLERRLPAFATKPWACTRADIDWRAEDKGTVIRHVNIMEHRPDPDDLLVRARVGWRDGVVGQATFRSDMASTTGRCLRTGDPVAVSDIRANAEFQYHPVLHQYVHRRSGRGVSR